MHLNIQRDNRGPSYLIPVNSGMDGDWGIAACWSTIPSYTPTTACVYDEASDAWGPYTKTFSYDTSTITQDYMVETGTVYTSTETINLEENSQYSGLVAISAVPMVTLVHKQSDIEAAKTAGAATSSNAAGRLNTANSALDGLGMTVGVCISAMALGAAIIFQ